MVLLLAFLCRHGRSCSSAAELVCTATDLFAFADALDAVARA
jgi:hypothetical protein